MAVKNMGSCSWVHTPALPLTGFVIFAKFLNLSVLYEIGSIPEAIL